MSTILSEKKTLSPWAKGGIGLGAGALLLVLVGLLFPTAAAFFPLVSLWCSCVLFYGALWVLHTAGVELDFFHRAAIIAFWAGAVLYFYLALGRRVWQRVSSISKYQSFVSGSLHCCSPCRCGAPRSLSWPCQSSLSMRSTRQTLLSISGWTS